MLAAREYSRMLLTHNGRLARQLTNLASSVRTEVCSPESSHERDDATRFVGWDRRGRSDVLDDAPSGGWVEIKLTEALDTDPCTQAPVTWWNADYRPSGLASPYAAPSGWINLGLACYNSESSLESYAERSSVALVLGNTGP
jgi:hypothetical protein